MSQEGAAKLRLKARKAPPPACSREISPDRESPRRRRVSAGSCSWFEKEDLNECEKTWILLLKAIGQDLQCTNWQTVPSFPEFFGKSSEEESLQNQEVFTIGMKDFQWVSFPSFPKEKCLEPKGLSSHQLTQSQIDRLQQGWGPADTLKSLPSTAEKTCCGATTDHIQNTGGGDTKGISKLDRSPKSCKLTQQRSSAHPLALSQSSAEAFSFQQLCRGTEQNRGNGKDEREKLQTGTHGGPVSSGEARRVPAEEKPRASVPGPGSCTEETANQRGGSSTLDSCPMCLIHFSGTLSQLDIDGHLARCLSESTDDVMW